MSPDDIFLFCQFMVTTLIQNINVGVSTKYYTI